MSKDKRVLTEMVGALLVYGFVARYYLKKKKGDNQKIMKVYVMTKFKPFEDEIFVGVKRTKKEAFETLREIFPFMRGSIENNNLVSDAYLTWLLSIKEIDI